jgi:S-layer homology domain
MTRHPKRGLFAMSYVTIVAVLLQSGAAFADTPTSAVGTTPPSSVDAVELAQAMTTPFPDVPANHWAYEAIGQLASSGYLKGYPDDTFKGQRPMTRYEVAYLVNQVVQNMANKVAQGQQANQTDLDALKKLMAEFGNQVKDLETRVARLEGETATLQQKQTATQNEADATAAKADATAQRLAGGKLGFRFYDRAGTLASNVQMSAPAGILTSATGAATPGTVGHVPNNFGATPGNYGSTFAWSPGLNNRTVIGPQSHGTNELYGAIYDSGNFGQGFSWGARISQRADLESATGLTAGAPAFCTSTGTTNASPSSCSYGDFANSSSNIPLALDNLYAEWQSPGHFYTQIGRFSLYTGLYAAPARWAGSNVTGFLVGLNGPGIHSPKNDYNIWLMYAPETVTNNTLAEAQATGANAVCSTNVVGLNLGAPIQTGLNGSCNAGEQEIASQGQYYFRKSKTAIGYEFDGEWNLNQAYWDPAAVACTGGVSGVSTNTALSAPVCAASGGHVPGGAALGNAYSGSYISATGPNAAWWIDASHFFGCCNDAGQFQVALNYGQRIGNDPFTGTSWAGSQMIQATLTYASRGNLYGNTPNPFYPGGGTANSNVVQLYWEYAGLGAGSNGFPFSGSVVPENNTAFSNAAGLQHWLLAYSHWFNNNFRAGITLMHWNENPNVVIPAGSLTCPGCFVNSANMNQVYLETYLYFN